MDPNLKKAAEEALDYIRSGYLPERPAIRRISDQYGYNFRDLASAISVLRHRQSMIKDIEATEKEEEEERKFFSKSKHKYTYDPDYHKTGSEWDLEERKMDPFMEYYNSGINTEIIAESFGISNIDVVSCLMEDKKYHVGIFVPIPGRFNKFFPKERHKEDSSQPHITLLYIGECDSDEKEKIDKVCKEIFRLTTPFRVKFGNYSEFINGDQRVPHIQMKADRLHKLNDMLMKKLKESGIDINNKYKEYRPHATLSYVPVKDHYEGPVPTGDFTVKRIELWGFNNKRIYNLG